MNKPGLVHIYAGNGKGKTSAATGLCVRAAGRGLRVLFAQLLKGKPTGELASLERLGVTTVRCDGGTTRFVFTMNDEERAAYSDRLYAEFEAVSRQALSGDFDVVVLDEVLDAIGMQVLPEAAVLALIDGRPAGTELVLTGRGPSEALISRAGYYTVFQCEKHPYEQGVQAREGIEF